MPSPTPGTLEHPQETTYGRLSAAVADYVYHLRLISRNARLYLLGSFLIGVNFHVFNLLLNLYLREFGFGEAMIGQVTSARAVGMTMIAIPGAILLSRVRLKPILLTSVALVALFSVFITTYEQLSYLMLFSFLSGVAFAFYRVAGGPFFMRNSTPIERTYLFSLSFGMMILAGMVGSLGFGHMVTWLADRSGDIIAAYRYTLYTGIGVGLLALIPFAMIKSAPPSAEENRISISWDQLRRRGGFYLRISIANFLVGLGAGLIIPFLPLFFRDRFGLDPGTISIYYSCVQFSMFAGLLAGPVLVQRLGMVRTVVVTQLISIPFMLILSYSMVLPLVVAAFILRGGLMNLGVPIVNNFGMELSEKVEQGLVNAFLMLAWTSSWMVSNALGGILIEKYGYTSTMNITIALYIVSSVIFYWLYRDAEVKTESYPRWIILREEKCQ